MSHRILAVLLFASASLNAADASFNATHATNSVGLDLFRQLAPASGNLVISPYSIESGLALAYAGADGDCRAEMARVLRFPANDDDLQAGFATLRNGLDRAVARSSSNLKRQRPGEARDEPSPVIQWAVANRLFGQRGYAFRASFLEFMRDGFAAPFEPLDFRGDAEGARHTINRWVEDQTHDKINNLIPTGGLTADGRLVLVNALYLKAPWQSPFMPAATRPQVFHARDGDRDVSTMHQTEHLGYARDAGLTVVTLDYQGRGLQFLILLPDEGITVEAAAATLTPEHFSRWAKLGDRSSREVALALPKFRIAASTLPLGNALRTLGMKRAFDVPAGTADFSRIAPRRADDYLALSDVFHQTFIDVDELGTEASAATAVAFLAFSAMGNKPPPIEVRVDRPFLFAVQHRASGACLFLGRIVDPR